jgi:hypothetical protein
MQLVGRRAKTAQPRGPDKRFEKTGIQFGSSINGVLLRRR